MNWMEAIGAVLACILMIQMALWAADMASNPDPEKMDDGVRLAADAAKPWYLDLIVWLAQFGTLGAVAIFAIIYFAGRK